MIEILIGPFLAGLASAVPRLVSSWIETRNALRVEYTRAHLNGLSEEHRLRMAVQLQRIELDTLLATTYPLGVPGHVRSRVRGSGLPVILVSPPPPGASLPVGGAAERIEEILSEVQSIDRYGRVISGAFVREAGQSRYIDGENGARTIARSEFGLGPAILIYFEWRAQALSAHAYLSTVFGSVGGDSGFPFVVARYSRERRSNGPAVLARDGDLPSWHHIDLRALPEADPVDVVAYTVALFLLATIDAYWEMRTGQAPGLLAQARAGWGGEDVAAPRGPTNAVDTTPPPNGFLAGDPHRRARLEQDARQLAEVGYEVTAEELGAGYVGLHVRGMADVIFVVDARYPQAPPVVIRFGDTDIEIEPAHWSSECTLADVVEAAR
jgi:hypothetical protein